MSIPQTLIDSRMKDAYQSIAAACKAAKRLDSMAVSASDIHTLRMIATQSAQAAAEINQLIGILLEKVNHG